jgi:hypothetical protein
MINIENNLFGFALYIAAEYVNWRTKRIEDGHKVVDSNALDIARDHAPFLVYEQEEVNEEIMHILRWIHDDEEEEGQTSLFYPVGWFNVLTELISAMINGQISWVDGDVETYYRHHEDKNTEAGILMTTENLLSFHKKLYELAQHGADLACWAYGSFILIVEISPEDIERWQAKLKG